MPFDVASQNLQRIAIGAQVEVSGDTTHALIQFGADIDVDGFAAWWSVTFTTFSTW